MSHRLAARRDQGETGVEIEDTGGRQRRVLPERMARRRDRGRGKGCAERLPQGERHGIERWLGAVGSDELLLGPLGDDRAERPAEDRIGTVPEQVGARGEHVGTHADRLAALSREQNGDG